MDAGLMTTYPFAFSKYTYIIIKILIESFLEKGVGYGRR